MNNKKSNRNQTMNEWPEDDLEWVLSCPVCGGSKNYLLYSGLKDRTFYCAPGSWSLCSCAECQSAYLNPRPTPDTIGLAYKTYFTHETKGKKVPVGGLKKLKLALYNGYLYGRHGYILNPSSRFGNVLCAAVPPLRAKLDRYARHLGKPKRAGDKLIDVGCGNGDFVKRCVGAGWHAQGVDADPDAVKQAKEEGVQVSVGTVESLRFPDDSFSVVTLNHVIEHFHDPVGALRECQRILKPGGRLWLSTPDLNGIGHRRYNKDWFHLDPPRHLTLFHPDALKHALGAAGFSTGRTIWPGFHIMNQFKWSKALQKGVQPIKPAPLGYKEKVYAMLSEFQAWRQSGLSEEIIFSAVKSG